MLMNYIKRNNKPGTDISCWLCADGIKYYDYAPASTLREAKELFQSIYQLFDGDIYILEKLEDACILSEAYSLIVNNLKSIPTTPQYFDTLRILIRRYEKSGYIFSGELYDQLMKGWENSRKIKLKDYIALAKEIKNFKEVSGRGLYFVLDKGKSYYCNPICGSSEEFLTNYMIFTNVNGLPYYALEYGEVLNE